MLAREFGEENVIEILGLRNLPIERQTEILNLAAEVVETRAIDRLLEELTDDETDAFVQMLKRSDEAGMAQLLQRKNINILAILQDEIQVFKNEMKDEMTPDRSERDSREAD